MISVKADFERIKRELDASPKKIETNAKRALNRAAKTLRVAARREIQQEIGPKKGAVSSINRRIKNRIHPSRLSVFIDFNEQGLGVEHTAKATVRKVRNGAGSVKVNFRGKTLVRAFRYGADAKVFQRKAGKAQRVYSFTMLQEAQKAKVPEMVEQKAGPMFVTEFVRLMKVFR